MLACFIVFQQCVDLVCGVFVILRACGFAYPGKLGLDRLCYTKNCKVAGGRKRCGKQQNKDRNAYPAHENISLKTMRKAGFYRLSFFTILVSLASLHKNKSTSFRASPALRH